VVIIVVMFTEDGRVLDPLTGDDLAGKQPPPPVDGAGSFFGLTWWTASNIALALVSIAIVTGLLIALTIHTDVWSGFSDNHVTSAEREQILGPTVAVDSLAIAGTGSSLPVLSDVVVHGDLIIENPSTTTVNHANITENTQINGKMTSPRIGNGTVDIIEYVTIIDDTCSPEDFAELLDEGEMFLLQIQTDTPLFFLCPANLSAILDVLQQSNNATTFNHTIRLERVANTSCNGTSQQAQNLLNRLVIVNVELDVTETQNNVTRDELEVINMVLDGLEASYPGLINATCSYNATLFTNTQQLVIDQRTILNGTNDLLDTGTVISGNCAAVMVNVTLAIDGYNTTLTNAIVTFNTLNGTYTEYRQNLTLYENQHTLLRQEFQANNASLQLLQNNYTQCLADTALLQSRLDALWQRYQTLRSIYTSQNLTYTELDTLFRDTYALFNATEAQCAAAQAQLDALLTSINTLYAQYLSEYNSYQLTINSITELQNNASSLAVRITVLELNVVWLFGNITNINGILDTINATLISVADDVTNTTLTLNQVNNTLVTTDNAITVVENGVITTNATLVTVAERTVNQTAEIVDHQIRIDALIAAGCPAVQNLIQVADNSLVAGANMTAGTVLRVDPTDGRLYPATGLYAKDAFMFDSTTTLQGREIQSTPRSAVDASDHFYSVYQIANSADPSDTFQINGFNVTRDNLAVVKFSPIHQVLWVAGISGIAGGPGDQILFINNIELNPTTNTLALVGIFHGDVTTSSVRFTNADGSDSGLSLTGVVGINSTVYVPFFGQITATGVWRNVAVPTITQPAVALADDGILCTGTSITSTSAVGGKHVMVSGICSFGYTNTLPYIVEFPGGHVITKDTSVSPFRYNAGYWGLLNLDTFLFSYVNELVVTLPPSSSGGTTEITSIRRDSGDAVFAVFVARIAYSTSSPIAMVATYNTTVPGASDTIVFPTRQQNGVHHWVGFMKIDVYTGGVIWATVSNDTRARIRPDNAESAGGTAFIDTQHPDITVDHADNLWVVFDLEKATSDPLEITYQGTTFTTTTAFAFHEVRAFVLFRLSAVDGQLIDGNIFPYVDITGSFVGLSFFMAGTFVTSGVGDIFLVLSFPGDINDSGLVVDGVQYSPNGEQLASLILKFDGISATHEAIYFDDYADASIALDSHGNLWTFLNENAVVFGDSPTFGLPAGIGIVKLGQHNFEPFGVAGHNATVGQPLRVVFEGVITMPQPHGYPIATQLYNDEGALVDNVPYGSTKIATVISDTDILVQIHRPMINQQII